MFQMSEIQDEYHCHRPFIMFIWKCCCCCWDPRICATWKVASQIKVAEEGSSQTQSKYIWFRSINDLTVITIISIIVIINITNTTIIIIVIVLPILDCGPPLLLRIAGIHSQNHPLHLGFPPALNHIKLKFRRTGFWIKFWKVPVKEF